MTANRIIGMFALFAGCSGRGAPESTPSPPEPEKAATSTVESAVAPTPPVDCLDEPGMIYIPGGESIDYRSKKPAQVPALWFDRTEVTVAAFRKYVEAGHDKPYEGKNCNYGAPDGDQLPVNCIDWYQAEAFCLWSGKRLPSSLEWGWAAQGREERRKYPWGDAPPTCDLAVIDLDDTDDVTGCGRGGAWPVGTKPTDVTRDGLLDMLGNVGEKTSTGFREDPKSSRLNHGTSWANNPGSRPVAELFYAHGYETQSDKVGVRCVKEVGPKPPCGGSPL